MKTFTNRILVSCILAGSVVAGTAEAACDRATIAPAAGRTYQVLADWRYFDRNGVDAIRPTGTGYKIGCEWKLTPKGNGHTRAQITCQEQLTLDSAGRILSAGKLPMDDQNAEPGQLFPLPFWLSQDRPFDFWDVLPRPNHELRRRGSKGSACVYDLVDLATEGEFKGQKHPPYLVLFGSDGRSFSAFGIRVSPGESEEIGEVGEVVTVQGNS